MTGTKKKNKVKNKSHKITVTLSDRDYELLKCFAARKEVSNGVLVKQIVHSELQKFKESIGGELPVKNQLSIFDSVQTDIFNCME